MTKEKELIAKTDTANIPMWHGDAMILLVAFLAAWQTPFARLLQDRGTSPIGSVTMLFVVSAVLNNAVILCNGRFKTVYTEGRQHFKVLALMGLFNFAESFGLFFSAHTLDAGVSIVLLYMAPVFISLFYLVTKIRPVPVPQRFAIVVCIFGCLLTVDVFRNSLSSLSISGIMWGLLGAVCFGGYTVCNDLAAPQGMDKWTAITIVMDVAAVLSVFAYPGMFREFACLQLADIGIFLYLAGVTKIINLLLVFAGIKIIGATRASVVQATEIPFTQLVAFITLRQLLEPVQFIGIGLVVFAVMLMQKK